MSEQSESVPRIVAEAEEILSQAQTKGFNWGKLGRQLFVSVFSAYGGYGARYLLDDDNKPHLLGPNERIQ